MKKLLNFPTIKCILIKIKQQYLPHPFRSQEKKACQKMFKITISSQHTFCLILFICLEGNKKNNRYYPFFLNFFLSLHTPWVFTMVATWLFILLEPLALLWHLGTLVCLPSSCLIGSLPQDVQFYYFFLK